MSQNHYRKDFPIQALYNSIRLALEEVRTNLQAPVGLIAGAFWTALSICAEADNDVLQPTGQISPCALYVGTIADSGERKTAVDKIVLAALYARDAKQAAEYKKALVDYQADMRYWEAMDTAIQRKLVKAVSNGEDTEQLRRELREHADAELSRPERNRIVYQSVTERPLMEALQGDSKCIAILSDEGSIVLNGGATNKLAALNKAWDGPSLLTFDRADDSIEARDPRVTVSFMIQEKVFLDFMKRRGEIARESGFLARFMVCRPASTQGFRYMSLDEAVWEHLPKFHQRMDELLEATAARRKAGDTQRRLLSFSPEAKELWVKAQNTVEPKLQHGGELESVRDFASKSMEIVGRLAACMHHFEGVAGNVISMETLQRALDVVDYYFYEYLDLFGNANDVPQSQKDVQALVMYLHSRYWLNGFSSVLRNDVRKSGPIRHQGRFEAAIQRLIWDGSIAVCHEQQYARKGRLWVHLNPNVFSQIASQ
ncbi:DUF3987 domain-containing protein [Rhodanobacter denitrificans]|uniref:DUF3987 domain-containing protein n=1 Tax=Rhodanobacter denitrificans TaxID=666685 RepID=A0A368K9T5_9GAMM|nr:YfjI family protein [Rhodanobacter denitrificans]RCS28604.1 DUF3987 domain-containing protein [Rhodanobacter denitrificans]